MYTLRMYVCMYTYVSPALLRHDRRPPILLYKLLRYNTYRCLQTTANYVTKVLQQRYKSITTKRFSVSKDTNKT